MNRSDLIRLMAGRHPHLLHLDVEACTLAILEALTDQLTRHGRVEIRGFGSFEVRRRSARIGRNPKSGEKVDVPEKIVPYFKAGKELRTRVLKGHDS